MLKYFELRDTNFTVNDLVNKTVHIFNTVETGLQLNTRHEYLLAATGSKSIPASLPPNCILTGKTEKKQMG